MRPSCSCCAVFSGCRFACSGRSLRVDYVYDRSDEPTAYSPNRILSCSPARRFASGVARSPPSCTVKWTRAGTERSKPSRWHQIESRSLRSTAHPEMGLLKRHPPICRSPVKPAIPVRKLDRGSASRRYFTSATSMTTLWILPVKRVASRPIPMPSTTGV